MTIKYLKLITKRFCIYGNPKGGVWNTPRRKITNDKLKLHMAKFGKNPAPITPGLWRHQTPLLQISLIFDDFGVKYELQEYITHLIDALKTVYNIYEERDVK